MLAADVSQGLPPSQRVTAKTGTSALNHGQKETPAVGRGEERKWRVRSAVVFVELASLAISQGWICRAKMPH